MLGRIHTVLSFTVIVAGVFCAISAVAAEAGELRGERDESTISLFDGDRPVLRYRYSAAPMKPYADRLYSPAGVQVLRDSPSDHKHHHGLMFAVAVDGVNFWEERRQSGKELNKEIRVLKPAFRDGVGRVGFVQKLHWVGPGSEKPMLIERRRLALLKADDINATLVDWRSILAAPPGKEAIELSGSHYFGLGLRLVESMDDGGRFIYSHNRPIEHFRLDQRLTPSKWCAYTAEAEGKQATVALFDHPANPRHPAAMYTMTERFAYLSATVDGWKSPLAVKAGRPLELRYGVALWDGETEKTQVERLYQRWLKLSTMNFRK